MAARELACSCGRTRVRSLSTGEHRAQTNEAAAEHPMWQVAHAAQRLMRLSRKSTKMFVGRVSGILLTDRPSPSSNYSTELRPGLTNRRASRRMGGSPYLLGG